jgi:serine/threonine-protein kinase
LADAPNHPTPPDAADTATGGSSGSRADLGPGGTSLPGQPGDATRAGTGFDTALGKLLVERGVIQQSALEECLRELRVRAADNKPSSLQDLLAERKLASSDQIDKARADTEAAEATRASTKIPGYQMLRKLGQGAMAKVYLARQKSLDRLVAIKVLPPKLTTDNFVARFQKEGRAAASLSHNNIVAAYEIGEANGYHYFVMEYVDGDTVYDRIVARKRLPEREALEIIRQIASALEHAHERGFVHRDIKPRNIMMTRSGVAKLADLGLARSISDRELAESEAGRAYGTPFYISPEQIQGKVDIGPPADIYGLGATFYHMVTGRVPYEAKTQSEVMQRHLRAPLVPPDHLNPQISAGTALIIETMLAKDVRDRYRNARDLIKDIDLVLAGQDPEFAKPALDIGAIATAVQASAQEPVEIVRRNSDGPLSNPLVLSLIAFLTMSVVGNIVLVLLLLAK